MGEVINYRREFLPHIIRLFSPGIARVDGRLAYFLQLFSLYQPSPEESCLLVKGEDKLLACAYLVTLGGIQENLVYANIAVDRDLPSEDWAALWGRCQELARNLASGPPILRLAVGEHLPLPEEQGFQVVREYVELHARLGVLPPVQEGTDDFHVLSLAEAPHLQQAWLDIFNQGLTVFYDIPPINAATFQRLHGAPGYDGTAFRLGLAGDEPATALFYSVLDSNQGLVRINAAATPSGKRSRGFGRRMLKETLNHLEQEGYKEAIIYTDSANQATNLLFKMLGFSPRGKVRVVEWRGQ
ncbi:MAG: GNAT family N-acetyltransferase [Bacillota bacterium]|jgi:GNAT superfamily N-acetyltransferase